MSNPLKLKPPQKTTIVDAIIEQLVEQIHNGTLKPNDKLPSERQLIEMLGVGRSSVREALQGLAAMGLIETKPGQGTFVREQLFSHIIQNDQNLLIADLLQKEMRFHLNQARLLVEKEIISLAAENISDTTRELINKAWNDLIAEDDDKVSKNDHLTYAWNTHDRFHLTLARATGNPFLEQTLQALMKMVPDYLRDKNITFGDREMNERIFKTFHLIHEGVKNSVISGNRIAAREWIKMHSEYEKLNIEACFGNDDPEKRLQIEKDIQSLIPIEKK